MTRKSRREIEHTVEELESSTPSNGEYADSPDLTADDKRQLNELFAVDVWESNADTRAAVAGLHDRYGGEV